MTTLSEGRHAGGFILSEASGNRSRAALLIAASMTVLVGVVLGKVGTNEGAVTVGSPSLAGTGNGVLTKATPAHGAGVQEGDYKIHLTEKTTDSGQFQVVRPDGTIDGIAVVGVAYDGQVKFTIADGSTDFDQTSVFTLAVAIAAATDEGSYKVLDLAATDGAETAAAIAIYPATTAADQTEKIAGIVRDAEVNGHELVWPVGITSDQKAAATAQLAAQGIIIR